MDEYLEWAAEARRISGAEVDRATGLAFKEWMKMVVEGIAEGRDGIDRD